MTDTIDFSDFLKVDIRVGTILSARPNEKAIKPAYVLEVDFGPDYGTKLTSAQITAEHSLESLPGMQVLAVVNFPPKRVAGVKSEVLTLATMEEGGRTVLITPSKPVPNGTRLL
ncbi:tRNA-binding protein [Kordiimonas marina]|uniref:tRNA-binding protein n=1 Tax=Kordiimonas marina TaxID=2872312 RepID=UPI001FF25335|nr:tRNA-binding protein [Kordiimonas marina]MCJ9430191.1 tRNA-binding protein [Kordiimonas marina]